MRWETEDRRQETKDGRWFSEDKSRKLMLSIQWVNILIESKQCCIRQLLADFKVTLGKQQQYFRFENRDCTTIRKYTQNFAKAKIIRFKVKIQANFRHVTCLIPPLFISFFLVYDRNVRFWFQFQFRFKHSETSSVTVYGHL